VVVAVVGGVAVLVAAAEVVAVESERHKILIEVCGIEESKWVYALHIVLFRFVFCLEEEDCRIN
jgi:hypothetical protein